jgi:hypothetical protein
VLSIQCPDNDEIENKQNNNQYIQFKNLKDLLIKI